MTKKLTLLVTIISLAQLSHQGVENNEVDRDKFNAFAEVAGAMMGSQGGDLGGMISNLMASEGGKQLGDMLLNSNGAANVMQGLGAMLEQGGGSGTGGGGLDMNMIGNMITAFSQNADIGKEGRGGGGDGFDLSSAINLAKSFMDQDGSKNFMNYLPTIISLFNVLTAPVPESMLKEHAGHSWMLPPIIERFHILADQLMNSDLGRDLVTMMGAEKFIKLFTDNHGHFSYRKFVDMMENHSFRKHWIQRVTSRIADFVTYLADPYTQRKTIATVQFFMNNFLKSYGVPKHALYDPTRPAESLTALANYLPKRYLGLKFNSAEYVVPAVNYVNNLMRMAENKGILGRAINANELTNTLTDTINLEIIEPLARVNRAVRFAQKRPVCIKYVLCVANQHEPDEMLSLPGLKKALANSATFGATWLLSNQDKTPFWTLYGSVNEGKRCERFMTEECKHFHVEEERVTTEYVHNEL